MLMDEVARFMNVLGLGWTEEEMALSALMPV
jgi:hypothetical protein